MDYRHLERHSQRAQGDTWVARFVVRLPANEGRPGPADVRRVAEEMLKTGGDRGDDRYISIARADLSEVEYHFDGAAWTRDNFGSLNPQFEAPLKLAFRYQNQIPRFIYTSAPVHDLERYIVNLFKQHVERNKRALLGGSAVGQVIQGAANAAVPKDTVVQSMLSQAVDRLFDVELDYQRKRIVAKLSGLGVGIVAAAAQQSASSSGAGAHHGKNDERSTARLYGGTMSSAGGSNASSRPDDSQKSWRESSRWRRCSNSPDAWKFGKACYDQDLSAVKYFIRHGWDPNTVAGRKNGDDVRHNVLFWAIRGNSGDDPDNLCARYLIESGADVTYFSPPTNRLKNQLSSTPVLEVIRDVYHGWSNTRFVQFLIEKGGDPHQRVSIDRHTAEATYDSKVLRSFRNASWNVDASAVLDFYVAKTTDGATLGRLSSVQHMLGEFTQNPTTEGGGTSSDQDSGRHKDRPRITQTADSDDQTVAQGTGPRNSAQANNSSSSSGTQTSSRSTANTESRASSKPNWSPGTDSRTGAANVEDRTHRNTSEHAGLGGKMAGRSSDKVVCLRCSNSGKPVKRFNWLLFFALLMFTSGIGSVIYLIHYIFKKPDRCPVCSAKLGV